MKIVRNLMHTLFILVSFLLTNCQSDTVTEIQQEETLLKESPFKSTLLSAQDIESNNKLSTKMRSLATLQQGSFTESTSSEIYNFTIDATIVKFVENVETNTHSYTFSISRENNTSSVLENVVFSYNETMDDYDASLVTYHFTELQRQEFIATRHVNSSYQITYEPLTVNLSDILGEDSLPCTITYAQYHIPNGSRNSFLYSTNGHIQNDCEHEGANDIPCATYTNIVIYCPPSGSGSSNGTDDNSTNDDSTASTTGGGGDASNGDVNNDEIVVVTSPISIEESIKQSILECINTLSFDNSDTTTIDPEILEQVSLTTRQWADISNHLDENGCSETAQQEAIEDLLENFDEQVFKDQSFTNNNCLNSVYTEMGKASTFNNYLKNFEPRFSVAHLRFSASTSLPSDTNAETSAPNNYLITITFNQNNLNRPKLSVARTFIHEIIHAEIFRKLLSISQHPSIQLNQSQIIQLRNNYPGLYDYYTRWKWNVPQGQEPSSAQHEAMAQHYRSIIEQALREYDNTQTNEVYEALAWTGLRDTVAWNNLSQTQRDNIDQTVTNFFLNNPNCQ